MNKLKRYIIFLIGLFINALGVSFVTKASLGTSPISSIPYVLSLYFPLTLGNFTILFSILLIVLQILILRKNFKIENILQIPVSIAFGYFIDLTMVLLAWVNPGNYLLKIVALLIGCLILGFGVYLEVLADVVMLPGESFVRAVVQTWNTNFGTSKIAFDSSMTILAGILSFIFFGQLNGVREGTIIAALLVGFIARLFGKHLAFIKTHLFPEDVKQETSSDFVLNSTNRNVIVIGRQYGSGGHDIGKQLADKFGYQFFDQEIIEMTAGTTGLTPEFIGAKEESMMNNILYDLLNSMYSFGKEKEESPKDQIFEAESKVIHDLAKKGNCVIIGRCSDYILKDNPNVLKIFFTAPIESRIQRVMRRLNISSKEALNEIHKEEKMRSDNYHYYTGKIWGAASNFDLTVNTDLGVEYIERCITDALSIKSQTI